MKSLTRPLLASTPLWMPFVRLSVFLALANCSPGATSQDAGAFQFRGGVFNVGVAQDTDEIAVYTLERNFETNLVELGRATWAPSRGASESEVFGFYSARFGGSVFPVPRGARVYGLSDDRLPDERLIGRSGLQRFDGREVALTCDGLGGTSAAVYPDGSGLIAKTHRDSCGLRVQCPHVVFMSTNVDGGRSCPLEGISYDEAGDASGNGNLRLHPSMRVAGFENIAFFEWGLDGKRLRHLSVDAGTMATAPFWPSAEVVPTRVMSRYATATPVEFDATGVPTYFAWEGDRIAIHPTPFGHLMNVVDELTELPTGVVVQGRKFWPSSQPERQTSVGLLLDKRGTLILGKFRRANDGRSGAPNAYAEGQYFRITSRTSFAADMRAHAQVDIQTFDLVSLDP